ncbi:hypothetical protein D3C87_1670330 [compost metagenome]
MVDVIQRFAAFRFICWKIQLSVAGDAELAKPREHEGHDRADGKASAFPVRGDVHQGKRSLYVGCEGRVVGKEQAPFSVADIGFVGSLQQQDGFPRPTMAAKVDAMLT